jgi:hypothetical protein
MPRSPPTHAPVFDEVPVYTTSSLGADQRVAGSQPVQPPGSSASSSGDEFADMHKPAESYGGYQALQAPVQPSLPPEHLNLAYHVAIGTPVQPPGASSSSSSAAGPLTVSSGTLPGSGYASGYGGFTADPTVASGGRGGSLAEVIRMCPCGTTNGNTLRVYGSERDLSFPRTCEWRARAGVVVLRGAAGVVRRRCQSCRGAASFPLSSDPRVLCPAPPTPAAAAGIVGPDWPCSIFTYLLICVPSLAFLVAIAPQLHPAIAAVGAVLALMCVGFLALTGFSNPGYLRKLSPAELADARRAVEEEGRGGSVTVCSYCNVLREARTSHCYECNACVLELDHHWCVDGAVAVAGRVGGCQQQRRVLRRGPDGADAAPSPHASPPSLTCVQPLDGQVHRQAQPAVLPGLPHVAVWARAVRGGVHVYVGGGPRGRAHPEVTTRARGRRVAAA